MSETRVVKTGKNIVTGIIAQITSAVLSLVSRTVFIYTLGVLYLGINSLFASILMLLSFAEFGIGNAIIFSMYKPLATNQSEKIKTLMSLYGKIYRFIGIFIFLSGLLLLPFLNLFFSEQPEITESIAVIYILFLVNTSLSYFFSYKKALIIADQKNYIVLIREQAFRVLQTIAQIAFLLLTGNYIVYLIIQIISTFLSNLYISRKANRMYPILNEKNIEPLEVADKKSIIANIKSLFVYKFGSVILNGTDSILISIIVGVTVLGVSSNYILIISLSTSIIGQFFAGMTASIGNLNSTGTDESKLRVFNSIVLIVSWLYGFVSIGIFIFVNDLITLWIGTEFLLSNHIVFALVLHFYISGVQYPIYAYKHTTGLFIKAKFLPLIAAVVNIGLSLLLGYKFGLIGIFLATSIARLLTYAIFEPIIVYKYILNKSPQNYYIKYITFIIFFLLLGATLSHIINNIELYGIIGIAFKITIYTILYNGLLMIILRKTKSFNDLILRMKIILRLKK